MILNHPNHLTAVGLILLLGSCRPSGGPEHLPVPQRMMTQKSSFQIPLSSLVSARDTVCGMNLADGIGDTLEVGNLIYGFCSPGCKKTFRQSISR